MQKCTSYTGTQMMVLGNFIENLLCKNNYFSIVQLLIF